MYIAHLLQQQEGKNSYSPSSVSAVRAVASGLETSGGGCGIGGGIGGGCGIGGGSGSCVPWVVWRVAVLCVCENPSLTAARPPSLSSEAE
jgi:hypothetical protein